MQKKAIKAEREYKKTRDLRISSLHETVYTARAENRRREESQRNPLPLHSPKIVPLVSGVGDELPAIERERQKVPLRKAAGAESVDFDFIKIGNEQCRPQTPPKPAASFPSFFASFSGSSSASQGEGE